MNYLKFLFFFFISVQYVDAEYINLNVVRINEGDQAACDLAIKKFKEVNNNFEKSYYFNKELSCYYSSPDFIKLSLANKKEAIKNKSEKYVRFLKEALKKNEEVDYDLLMSLSVEGENYPRISEALIKKQIEMEMNTEHEVPDENEGDIHEMGPYVRKSYYDMARHYISNDMNADAQRIIKEYESLHFVGPRGAKYLTKKLDVFRVNLEKKRERKKNGITAKVDPNEVTKNLIPPKRKTDTQVNEVVKPQAKGVAKKSVEKIAPESIIKQYGLFILVLTIFFGLFLYSRRKNKQ